MKQLINWNEEKKYNIDQLLWGTTYNPLPYCQLVYKENVALYIHMFVYEKNPRAIYKHPNEPVYKDSCLECFFNMNPKQNSYLNIEVNANGVVLMGFGPERYKRKAIVPSFKPVAYKNEEGWGFVLKIPENFLIDLFKEIEDQWKANFFKCGDDCEYEHYLSWSPIHYPELNFHRVDCFGDLFVK